MGISQRQREINGNSHILHEIKMEEKEKTLRRKFLVDLWISQCTLWEIDSKTFYTVELDKIRFHIPCFLFISNPHGLKWSIMNRDYLNN